MSNLTACVLLWICLFATLTVPSHNSDAADSFKSKSKAATAKTKAEVTASTENWNKAAAIIREVYAVNSIELNDETVEEIISSFVYNGIQGKDESAPVAGNREQKSAYYLKALSNLQLSIHNKIYLEAQGDIAKSARQNEVIAKLKASK